jgi:hypothetical protein
MYPLFKKGGQPLKDWSAEVQENMTHISSQTISTLKRI